ncbi:hypothetical protein [Sphaerisporangium rufum]|nr:hypothetical protein [Sphaerisporangium rufum]
MWALELAPTSSLGSGISSVGGRERERFSLAGGELVIYDCEKPADARWAAWVGPWHIVHGMFYAPLWESADIVETFTRVTWTDTPEGMIADPGGRFEMSTSLYTQTIAGVGTLQVESRQKSTDQIPKWRGHRSRAGEIWRMDGADSSENEPLLMVTDSAVVTLSPWNAPQPGRPGIGARAAGLAPTEAAADFLTRVRRLDWRS